MQRRRKIMVLNLTRMGDIIQSIPFVRRLRLANPDAEIHTLVEECFTDVATFLPGVDRIHRVRLEDLLPSLASTKDGSLSNATNFYRQWIADLQSEGFDEVWNLTHTKPSVILNFLLAGEKGMGVTLDRFGLQMVNSPWLIYFYATNLARPWCQFNLVDIYANCMSGIDWQAGRTLDLPVDSDIQRRFESELTPGSIRVALHAGASQKSKQWPVQSFRKVAQRLLQNPAVELLLVGGEKDKTLADAFADLPHVHDYLGRTSVPELAALMKGCRLVISNDSGPMHVAAGVGTPVIAVTVGSALGSETAPYGEGHLVVEPAIDCFPCSSHRTCYHPICGDRVTAETIASLAEWKLGLRVTVPPDDLAGSRIYRTRFSGADQLLELERIFAVNECLRDELHAAIRPAWLSVLQRQENTSGQSELALPDDLHSAALQAEREARAAEMAAETLFELAVDRSSAFDRIQQAASELRSAEGRLNTYLAQHSLLTSIQMFSKITQASLQGSSLADQAQETADLYRHIRHLLQAVTRTKSTDEHIFSKVHASRKERHENLTQRS